MLVLVGAFTGHEPLTEAVWDHLERDGETSTSATGLVMVRFEHNHLVAYLRSGCGVFASRVFGCPKQGQVK